MFVGSFMHNLTLHPAYFHIHFKKNRKKKIGSTSMFYCPLSFLFCFEHYDILLDTYEENRNYHFISHLHIIIHQRLNHLLYALLIIIEVCNNLQSPCLVFITFILGTSMG